MEEIDDGFICYSCLYQDSKPFKIYPIGYIQNELERGQGFGVKGNKSKLSQIYLFHSQKSFLHNLDEEKHILVVYYLHKPRKIRSVFHRGLDGKKVGIFASRTPDRPSHIGISNVKLVKIEDTTLYVKNLDAINGTPVLDIKLGENSRW
ncbi:MAG: tRNA (N6-threonylcarbamoyladenosine(37)-N6)-methyltransferase TrmO [Candidatus Lokiarchaeota archaeon]|nr:tRNA (N6-threonylcarbamoyladenosine(37)-N6)-methyltransferase TrmO [Candidatus Lokiarchaeota archaeon]